MFRLCPMDSLCERLLSTTPLAQIHCSHHDWASKTGQDWARLGKLEPSAYYSSWSLIGMTDFKIILLCPCDRQTRRDPFARQVAQPLKRRASSL